MHELVVCVLSNVIVALVLACCIFALSRLWKNPVVLHAMWLLVLVKLVTPPIVQLPCLPNTEAWEPATTQVATGHFFLATSEKSQAQIPESPKYTNQDNTGQAVAPPVERSLGRDSIQNDQFDTSRPQNLIRDSIASSPRSESTEAAEKQAALESGAVTEFSHNAFTSPPTEGTTQPSTKETAAVETANIIPRTRIVPTVDWLKLSLRALGFVWFIGALIAIGRTFNHWRRFHRLVQQSFDDRGQVESIAVDRLVDDVSQKMSFANSPKTLMVNVAVAPMIWPTAHGAILILPTKLLETLSHTQVHSLIAHELAHLRSYHHWFRWFERAVASLYWWLPLVPIVSRQLRQHEEEVCDAWVINLLPEQAESYATLLVDTAAYLSQSRTPTPSLGIGMNHFSRLKRRISMIMNQQTKPRLSVTGWCTVLAALVVGVGFSPTQAPTINRTSTDAIGPDDLARQDEQESESQIEEKSATVMATTDDDQSELNFEGIVSTQLAVLMNEIDHIQSALELDEDLFEMGFEMEPVVRESTKKMLNRFPSASGQNLGIIVGSDLRQALLEVIDKKYPGHPKLEGYRTTLGEYYQYNDRLGQQFFLTFLDSHLCLSSDQENEIKDCLASNWDSGLNFSYFQPDFVVCGSICRELVGNEQLKEILTRKQWETLTQLDQLTIRQNQLVDMLMNNTGFGELQEAGEKLMDLQIAELGQRYSLSPEQTDALSPIAKKATSQVVQQWQQVAAAQPRSASRWDFQKNLPSADAERILQPLVYQIIDQGSWNNDLSQVLSAEQMQDWKTKSSERRNRESREFCAMFMYLLNQRRTLKPDQVESVVNAITRKTEILLGSSSNLNRVHQLIFSLSEAEWRQAIPMEGWEQDWPQVQLWMSQIKDHLPDE